MNLPSIPWTAEATATPLADLRAVKFLARAHSIPLDVYAAMLNDPEVRAARAALFYQRMRDGRMARYRERMRRRQARPRRHARTRQRH